jgi:hypothetical protein
VAATLRWPALTGIGVEREQMPHGGAAARAKGQLVAHVVVLGRIDRRFVGVARWSDAHVADGEAADLLGRKQVALQQAGREAQNRRDIVEAVARLVERKQGCDVDIDGQEIAHRVGVLAACQSVRGDVSGARNE